jgi:hypothetical protein
MPAAPTAIARRWQKAMRHFRDAAALITLVPTLYENPAGMLGFSLPL